MENKFAGAEPKYSRKAPEFWTPEEEEEAIKRAVAEARAESIRRQAERAYQHHKHMLPAAARAAGAVAKVAGLIAGTAGICIGTAYAVYWTAAQAIQWLSAQEWIKPVAAIAVLSAGAAAAVQYSRDSIKRAEKDRDSRTGGQADKRTGANGQTIIIYQNQNKT